jgi:predicted transcriptional regulator
MDTSKFPRLILEIALKLKDTTRKFYLTLYSTHKPSTAQEIAKLTGASRAHTSLRLNQLADMGVIYRSRKGREVQFEIRSVKDAHELQEQEETEEA